MNHESYPTVRLSGDTDAYDFVSIGPRGRILKRIEFIPRGMNVFVVAMGDVDHQNEIDCDTRTNNGDRDKVLSTAAKMIAHFVNASKSRILVLGSQSPTRMRLYQIAIGLHQHEFSDSLRVYAWDWDTNDIMPFRMSKKPDHFIITDKLFTLYEE
jgi:hypothetical protein